MRMILHRGLLAFCLCLGMILPKAHAALASLGVVQITTIVICGAHGLERITLRADGTPVKISAEDAPCGLVQALLPQERFLPGENEVWQDIALQDLQPQFADLQKRGQPPVRGPPFAKS